jgi:hypothetical protein
MEGPAAHYPGGAGAAWSAQRYTAGGTPMPMQHQQHHQQQHMMGASPHNMGHGGMVYGTGRGEQYGGQQYGGTPPLMGYRSEGPGHQEDIYARGPPDRGPPGGYNGSWGGPMHQRGWAWALAPRGCVCVCVCVRARVRARYVLMRAAR